MLEAATGTPAPYCFPGQALLLRTGGWAELEAPEAPLSYQFGYGVPATGVERSLGSPCPPPLSGS